MNLFSISQLEQFSGIKAHTIRMWEHRYKALNPHRSDGNTRYYDSTQLRRLLNITSLMGAEYKVSELCSMNDEKLSKLLNSQLKTNQLNDEPVDYFISQLLSAGMNFDEIYFEKIFSNCVLRFGIKGTYVKIIYPLLARIGMMWVSDNISASYEHFISNLIRQKLTAAIDALPPPKSPKNSWLLFLPENEFHETGLLLSNYLIRQSGKKVIYLGSNVPFDAVIQSVKEAAPAQVLFFMVHHNKPEESQTYLNNLQNNLSKTKIFLAGNEKLIKLLKIKKDMHWIRSVDELEKHLT